MLHRAVFLRQHRSCKARFDKFWVTGNEEVFCDCKAKICAPIVVVELYLSDCFLDTEIEEAVKNLVHHY